MPAVEDQIGVVSGPVHSVALQKVPQLGHHCLQGDAAGGVVAAERLDHVVGEEALHAVQHARGALVQLLHLLRWEESGLAVGTGQKRGRRMRGCEKNITYY